MLDTWITICYVGQKINTEDILKEILRCTTLGVEAAREESKIVNRSDPTSGQLNYSLRELGVGIF